MTVHKLTLAALMKDLDGGRIAEAFSAELRRVVADCDDRPADDKPRKVVLTFQLKPICDDQGRLDSVAGKFHCTSTVPQRRSKTYSFGYRAGDELVFDDLAPGNVHQTTFDVDDEEHEDA